MRTSYWLTCLVTCGLLLGCNRNSDNSGASAGDQGKDYGTSASTAAEPQNADNTGRNVRDRADSELTPGDQGTSEADREITRKIRRAITSNDQLSVDAKNLKIITTGGKVVLRGPVKSQQEVATIQSIVKQAGVNGFDNQMEVKSTNQ
jgi:hyperosmotically inducible periplasmic protein